MNFPLISIIVPIYKVEKYLRRCLDSILAQTYTHLEIILIDDGSPDNCGKICDEYAAQDSRIKVIHQKNHGVYVARNAGLQAASGEYIGFVDGDDYIKPDMYQTLLEGALKNQADITMCGQILLKPDGEQIVCLPYATEYMYPNNVAWLQDLMTHPLATHVLWNKLFTRQSIAGVCFNPQLRNAGDCEFLLDLLHRPLRITYIPTPLYYYVFRDSSITKCYSIRFFANRYYVWKHAIEMAHNMQQQKDLPWLNEVYKERFVPTAFMLAVFIILFDTKNEYHKELCEVQSVFCQVQKSAVRLSLQPIHRVWTWCFSHFPGVVVGILRLPGVRQLASGYILRK